MSASVVPDKPQQEAAEATTPIAPEHTSDPIEMHNGALSIFSFLAASARNQDRNFEGFGGDVDDVDDDEDGSSVEDDVDDNGELTDKPFPPIDHSTMPAASNTSHPEAKDVSASTSNHGPAKGGDELGPQDLTEGAGHDIPAFEKLRHQRRISTLENSVTQLVFQADDIHSDLSSDDEEHHAPLLHGSHKSINSHKSASSHKSLQKSRASALSEKLRLHLGIGDDEVLLGGK